MSNQTETVLQERKGKILQITLNRPHRGNSLDPYTLLALRSAFINAQSNPKVRVILLTGTGEKDFCTGIDLDEARDLTPANKTNLANCAGDIATLIYHGKPTIVAINGRAMGMGVVFSTAADYRIISEVTTIRMPELSFGAFPGASCTVIMARICGVAWSRRILLSCDYFTAEDAISAHIADEMCRPTQVLSRALEMAKNFTKYNPYLAHLIKKAILTGNEQEYMLGIEMESEMANFYQWDNFNEKIDELDRHYHTNFELTGNPDELANEYTQILHERQ